MDNRFRFHAPALLLCVDLAAAKNLKGRGLLSIIMEGGNIVELMMVEES